MPERSSLRCGLHILDRFEGREFDVLQLAVHFLDLAELRSRSLGILAQQQIQSLLSRAGGLGH
jgi:hypothetical protein